jgi:hypothetical protein
MNKLKTLSLLLLLVSITGIMVGSGGFTTVSADRDVSISVENDKSAYVGYQSDKLSPENGTTIELVTIENRLSDDINIINITIEDGNFNISNTTTPTDISPGETGTIQGTVRCTPNESQLIKLSVTVSGSDVTAQLAGDTTTRNFKIECTEEDGESGDGGEGNGNSGNGGEE